MLKLFVAALGIAACQASVIVSTGSVDPHQSARELTQRYFDAKSTPNAYTHNDNARSFYTPETKTVCMAEPLPCAGTYKGWEGSELLSHRFKTMFEVDTMAHQIQGCTEAKSLCLVKVTLSGREKETGQAFVNMEILESVTWDNITGKIISIYGAIRNKEAVVASVMPRAEKWFNRLVMNIFMATDESSLVQTLDSMVAPNIRVEIDGAHSAMLSSPVYEGKAQFFALLREEKQLLEQLPLATLVNLGVHSHDILFADNDDVYVIEMGGKFKKAVHYTFDGAGQVVSIKCMMLSDIKPWEMHEGPFHLLDKIMDKIAVPFARAFESARVDMPVVEALRHAAGNRMARSSVHSHPSYTAPVSAVGETPVVEALRAAARARSSVSPMIREEYDFQSSTYLHNLEDKLKPFTSL